MAKLSNTIARFTMTPQVAISCLLCVAFTVCGAQPEPVRTEQTELIRRIKDLEMTIVGLRADLNAQRVIQQQHSYKLDQVMATLNQGGVKGDPGQKGDTGPMGLAGKPGVPGVPGVPGAVGSQGLMGVKGDPGQKGDTGPMGFAGKPGVPGVPGAVGPKGEPCVKGP